MRSEHRLGDLIEIKYGKDHKKLDNGHIPVYGSGGIMRYANEYLYDNESILIPRKGTLNNIFYVTGKFWTVDTIFWSKINTEKVFGKFLYYYLFKMDFASMDVGSAVPSMTSKILNEIKINLPALKTQKKIAHILSTLDEKIELNRKMNQTLEAMAQTLFKSWFVDFDPVKAKAKCKNDEELESAALELGISKEVLELFPSEFEESELGMIPKGWEVKKLRDISKIVMGLSPKGESYNYENDGLPLLNGASDFNDGILIPIKYTTDSKRKAEKGTLVFCIRATIGLLTYTDKTYSLGRGVAAIEAKNVYRELIYLRLNSQIEQMKLMASGSVFQNLKKEDIEGLKIIIADDKIMKFFHIQHESLFNKIEANTKQIQTLQKTRDTLLPKLLSGELNVSDLDIENEG